MTVQYFRTTAVDSYEESLDFQPGAGRKMQRCFSGVDS
jgi:hypothetical protein